MLSQRTHTQWAELFAELLKKHLKERLVSVVLYGSVAAGKEREDSDIDLLVVVSGDLPGRYQRRHLLDSLSQEWEKTNRDLTPPCISTIIKTPAEAKQLSPLYFDMVDHQKILFDPEGFFPKILVDVQKRLSRLHSKRKKLGQIEYWDLKPDYVPGEVFEI